jgi:glucokinase
MSFPFDVRDEEEKSFAAFLAGESPILPTAGHVLSGSGLGRLHEFFTGKKEAPAWFTASPDFAASDTYRLFARFYGRFCRMAALSLLPQAVVIAGGVAEKTPALVRHEEFAREFGRAAGAHGDFLSRVPVWLNRHPQSGLWGAAEAGAMLARSGGKR